MEQRCFISGDIQGQLRGGRWPYTVFIFFFFFCFFFFILFYLDFQHSGGVLRNISNCAYNTLVQGFSKIQLLK